MQTQQTKHSKDLYYWVPSLYVLEALPFTFLTSVSLILYKNFNFSNAQIAFYTSLFTIPFFLKPLLMPPIEKIASRQTMIVSMSFLMTGLFLILSLCLNLKNFFYVSILIFLIIAFASAIFDANVDGLYIIYLNKKERAHFVGIRTVCYQIGRLSCQAGLVYFASLFFSHVGIKIGWQIALSLFASIMFIFSSYHYFVIPKKNTNNVIKPESIGLLHNFKKVFQEFINLPNLFYALAFIFIYNFCENQLIKIVPLFLLDHHGGLGLSTASVAIVYGGIGVIGMLFGILFSGFLLEKISLKYCLVPITIFSAISNIGYLLLSIFLFRNIFLIGFFIVFAQFGYGIINGTYMFYLLQSFGKGSYPASMYTIGTALMGFSMTIDGAISGSLQYLLGYTNFFIFILIFNFGIGIFAYYFCQKDKVIAENDTI